MSNQKLVSHKHNLSRPKNQFSFNEESSINKENSQSRNIIIPNNNNNNNPLVHDTSMSSIDKPLQFQQQQQPHQNSNNYSSLQQLQQQQSQLSFQLSNYKSTQPQEQSVCNYNSSQQKQAYYQNNFNNMLIQPNNNNSFAQIYDNLTPHQQIKKQQQQQQQQNQPTFLPLFSCNEVEAVQQIVQFAQNQQQFQAWLDLIQCLTKISSSLKSYNKAEVQSLQENMLTILFQKNQIHIKNFNNNNSDQFNYLQRDQQLTYNKQLIPDQYANSRQIIIEDIKKISELICSYAESGNSLKIWQQLQEHVNFITESIYKLMFQIIFSSSKNRAIQRFICQNGMKNVCGNSNNNINSRNNFVLDDDLNENDDDYYNNINDSRGENVFLQNKGAKIINNKAKKKKRGVIIDKEEDDDDYFSDFSDEHFEIEHEEEKIALNLISLLKEKLEDPTLYKVVQNYNFLQRDQDPLNIQQFQQKQTTTLLPSESQQTGLNKHYASLKQQKNNQYEQFQSRPQHDSNSQEQEEQDGVQDLSKGEEDYQQIKQQRQQQKQQQQQQQDNHNYNYNYNNNNQTYTASSQQNNSNNQVKNTFQQKLIYQQQQFKQQQLDVQFQQQQQSSQNRISNQISNVSAPESVLIRSFKFLIREKLSIEASDLEIECLLNRISITHKSSLKEEHIRWVLDKIRSKPFSWWRSKLELDRLEINYSNFNFKSFNSRFSSRRGATLNSLVQKLQIFRDAHLYEAANSLNMISNNNIPCSNNNNKINKIVGCNNNFNLINHQNNQGSNNNQNIQLNQNSYSNNNSNNKNNIIKNINNNTKNDAEALPQIVNQQEKLSLFNEKLLNLAGGKDFLSKSEFRRFTLFMEFPLSRKETKIIVSILDQQHQNSGKLSLQDITSVFLNPEDIIFLSEKSPDFQAELNQKQQMSEAVQTIVERARKFVRSRGFTCNNMNNNVVCGGSNVIEQEVRDVFRLNDTTKEAIMDQENFVQCIQQSGLPIERMEAQLLSLFYCGNFFQDQDNYQEIDSNNNINCNYNQKNNIIVDYCKFLDDIFSDEVLFINRKFYNGEDDYGSIDSQEQRLIQDQGYNQQFYEKGRQYKQIQMKINNLEFDNARLRRLVSENQQQFTQMMEERQSLIEKIEVLDQKVNSEVAGIQEKNFHFIRDNFLHKEMEAYHSLAQATQRNEVELILTKKKFEAEKNEYRRIIEQKNQEIESYRIELEGILEELEFMRRTQRDEVKRDLINIQKQQTQQLQLNLN